MRESQRLLRTIRCKRRRIVGTNCVRPFLICYELTGDRRSPLRLCGIFNIVSTANHYIPTIRRDRARPCPQQITNLGNGQPQGLSLLLTPYSLLRTPHSATVLPPFYRAGLHFERCTEFDIAAAFHTDARNQMLAGFANFNA